MINDFNKWLKQEKIQLKFQNQKFDKYFQKMDTILEFAKKEMDFWLQYRVGLLGALYNNYSRLYSNLNSLNTQLQRDNGNINTFKQNYKNHINQFNNQQLYNFVSSQAESKIMVQMIKDNMQQKCDGFFKILTKQNTTINNSNELSGAIEAIMYINDNFREYPLATITDDYNFIQKDYMEKIDNIQIKYDDFVNETNTKIQEAKVEFSSYKENTSNTLDSFVTEKTDELKNLELLFTEKLRLEGPGKHWQKLEKKYIDSAKTWTWVSVALSIVFITYLTLVLYNTPVLLDVSLTELSFSTLKGTIVFTLITSMFIYMIRIFVRLAFSGFHLSRDAKERYQLSHIYLALIKDEAIKDEDRKVVLQSLFSRADTGLLKGDSAPTLPDSITKQLLKIAE